MRSDMYTEPVPATEDLVRRALWWQADQAPPAGPVLTRLTGNIVHTVPTEARSRRRLLVPVGVAAAVAAAAIATPFVLHTGGTGADQIATAAAGSATVAVSVDPPVPAKATMPYRVGWAPAGVVQNKRLVTMSGGQRVEIIDWGKPGAAPTGSVQPNSNPSPPNLGAEIEFSAESTHGQASGLLHNPQAQQITVNGATGAVLTQGSGANQQATVVWLPKSGWQLAVDVSGLPDPAGIAQRMADSVVDGTGTVDVPLAFGAGLPTPGPSDTSDITVTGTSPTSVTAVLGQSEARNQVSAALSTQPFVPDPAAVAGAKQVTVRGQQGWYLPGPVAGTPVVMPSVLVKLDGGWLLVGMSGPADDLVRLANGMTVSWRYDYSWLGRA